MKRALLPLALVALLSGCAVYEPAGYATYPGVQPAPYPYAQNVYPVQPVYPATPMYVGPPVSFSFGFLFGGHHGGGWGHYHH